MKREILYRGKSKVTNEWLYGSLLTGLFTSSDGDLMYIVDVNKMNYDCWEDIAEQIEELEVDTNTIGQFTECNDIDGNRIFEGMTVNQRSVLIGDEDIDITGVVEFTEGSWLITDYIKQESINLWSEHRENRIIK